MRPNKKPAASTRSGGPVHAWSVVPPSLAALRARRVLPTLRAQNVGEHAVRRYDASGAGIRSMPRPVITEGFRRVLLALRRSSRVAARRTPHTGPEGGFSAFQASGLHCPRLAAACSAATCPSRRSYLRWTVLQNLPSAPEGLSVSGSCFIGDSFTSAARRWPALSSPQAFILSGELPASLARWPHTCGAGAALGLVFAQL
jgi:hypothetical protein